MDQHKDINVEYYSKELTLFKANILIDSNYKSTLLEALLFAISLAKINEAIEDKEGNLIVIIRVPTLRTLIPTNSGSFYTQLRNAARAMTGRVIGMSDPERQIFHFMSVVNNAHYENGELLIEFNKNLRPFLKDIITPYTQMNLRELLSFKSIYAFRLFEIIKSRCYTPKGSKEISAWKIDFNLSELKLMLGTVNSSLDAVQRILNDTKTPDWDKAVAASPEKIYKEWGDFRKRVILPAIDEINEKTCYTIFIDPDRGGRGGKTKGITFLVEIKGRDIIVEEDDLVEEPTFVPDEDVLDYILDISPFKMRIKEATAIADAADNDKEKISKAFKVLESQTKEIDNPVGFIISAIINEYNISQPYKPKSKRIGFNNFEQNDYDFDQIDKLMRAQDEQFRTRDNSSEDEDPSEDDNLNPV